jgi:superfamily I DNA and/or RNA helicase
MISLDTSPSKEIFEEYVKYVESLKAKFLPKTTNDFDAKPIGFRELFDDLLLAIQEASKNRKKDFYDIVEELKYKIFDTDNITALVRRYTNIVGSTCAQAKKTVTKIDLKTGGLYDYVIIDEAARANPLDIMLTFMMGTRVIIVGDQQQLPHFIESKEAREFSENPKYRAIYDGKLLQKSLFGLIYEQVEKSWNEKKLAFRRHVRITEQHRMHPIIGDFISQQFYEGSIDNGAGTSKNVNEYGIFDSKNIAWLNVPMTSGMEQGKPSYFRPAEVDKILDVIKDIVQTSGGKMPSIGIISFYKQQIQLIEEAITAKYPSNVTTCIECGTVDSFQGKEFDIVFLSTVRSNVFQTADVSLGFIHYSPSRINVALSRAKRVLAVVGDAETLGRNEIFKKYLDYVKVRGYNG